MREKRTLRGRLATGTLAALALLVAATAAPAAQKNPAKAAQKPGVRPALPAPYQAAPAAATEDFYIIISVNQTKKSLVLKMPTEVTTVMTVNDQTVYVDENGKRISFADLHAGDTVYVTHRHAADGEDLAVRIRKGPMTVAELHRRYVKFQ